MDADDTGTCDGGVLEQRVFNFLRADVRAIVNDDLLLAAAEPEVILVPSI